MCKLNTHFCQAFLPSDIRGTPHNTNIDPSNILLENFIRQIKA